LLQNKFSDYPKIAKHLMLASGDTPDKLRAEYPLLETTNVQSYWRDAYRPLSGEQIHHRIASMIRLLAIAERRTDRQVTRRTNDEGVFDGTDCCRR
jgi:hypothetical protein